ncbi:hypothetical protein Dimus_016405 [Dionaea muscipula]
MKEMTLATGICPRPLHTIARNPELRCPLHHGAPSLVKELAGSEAHGDDACHGDMPPTRCTLLLPTPSSAARRPWCSPLGEGARREARLMVQGPLAAISMEASYWSLAEEVIHRPPHHRSPGRQPVASPATAPAFARLHSSIRQALVMEPIEPTWTYASACP